MLVDVGALERTERDEVISQQRAVVGSHTTNLVQALVSVIRKLFSKFFELLGLLGEHELKGLFFVGHDLFLTANEFFGLATEAPLRKVSRPEQFLLPIVQSTLLLYKVDFD